jgi:Flp pilus assembly pilin Flp
MPANSFSRFSGFLGRLQRDTEGQDLVEYALLTGFMVVAVWAFFPTDIAPSISNIFSRLVSTASVLVP